jgi:phage gp29-like protein
MNFLSRILNRSNATPDTAPSPDGRSAADMVRQNNAWRDAYNPLRGLVISKLVSMFDLAQRGYFADLEWTYRLIERRYPVLRSLIARRKAALQKLDWNIKVRDELPKGTESLADEQRAFLRERYEKIRNLREAIAFLELAEFRGFSHIQKQRGEDGLVNEFYWLPQWCMVRDGMFGQWVWNPKSQMTSIMSLPEANRIAERPGDPGMPRDEFIIREVDMPINEIAAIAFLNCAMAKKDWAAFIEIYGLPGCVVIMPGNVPQGFEDKYEAAAKATSEGGSGAVPAGADVKFPTASIRGNSPFKEFLDYEEKDVVLAGTGGKLTMLNEATGIGGSQGQVHDEAFDDLACAEAAEISEVLQKQFDAQELALQWPGKPALAYFELARVEEADPAALTDQAVKLSAVWSMDPAEVSEKTGWKLEKKEAPEMPDVPEPGDQPEPPMLNRAPGIPATSMDAIYRAQAADLAPIRTRLERILKIEDPEIRLQAARRLQGELPQLLADINADPAATTPIQSMLRQAFAQGLNAPISNRQLPILNSFDAGQSRDELGHWVDENGGGLSEHDNIQRGQKAVDRAIRQKKDVQKAMYRQGLGQIDFVWGRPGNPEMDSAGRTHADGYGISHILAKHGELSARELPVALAKGKIVEHKESPTKREIHHGDFIVSVVKENSRKAWVLTGYESRRQVE